MFSSIYNKLVLKGKTVALVIKCYNEEKQIIKVLNSIPDFVDKVIVVNDKSTDNTANVVKDYMKTYGKKSLNTKVEEEHLEDSGYNGAEIALREIKKIEDTKFTPSKIENESQDDDKIILISHLENGGPGATVATGYKWARDHKIDCTAVIDGDGQMDTSELKGICLPVVIEEADYVKANRLKHRSALLVMPKIRFFGNSVLSLLTKVASGYWYVTDTQTGFTAISLRALEGIRIHKIYKRYGYPNDILVKLNISGSSVKEIDSKPVYNVGERSDMNELKVIPGISWLLLKLFFKRLYQKYLFRDFHPLFMLYNLAFILFIIDLPFLSQVITALQKTETLKLQSLIIFTFLTIFGFQSLFFAMWMDMIDNERLWK